MNGKVKVEYSKTINMGNYENVKLTASLELPCHATTIQETYRDAWLECKRQVEEQEQIEKSK